MKEQYIKQIEREFGRSIPRKKREEIRRDLNEIFSSAIEHGETEQQVVERLGAPEDFVKNTIEQLGPAGTAPRRRRRIISGMAALLVAAAAFSLYAAGRFRKVPDNAIGYAEAMTGIRVQGAFAIDASPVVLAVGAAAAVFAAVQIIRLIRDGGK